MLFFVFFLIYKINNLSEKYILNYKKYLRYSVLLKFKNLFKIKYLKFITFFMLKYKLLYFFYFHFNYLKNMFVLSG